MLFMLYMSVILYQLTSSPRCFFIPIWDGSTRSKLIPSLFLLQSTRKACRHICKDADIPHRYFNTDTKETTSTCYFLTVVLTSSSSLACSNERNFPDARCSNCIHSRYIGMKVEGAWTVLVSSLPWFCDRTPGSVQVSASLHIIYKTHHPERIEFIVNM